MVDPVVWQSVRLTIECVTMLMRKTRHWIWRSVGGAKEGAPRPILSPVGPIRPDRAGNPNPPPTPCRRRHRAQTHPANTCMASGWLDGGVLGTRSWASTSTWRAPSPPSSSRTRCLLLSQSSNKSTKNITAVLHPRSLPSPAVVSRSGPILSNVDRR